MATKVTDVLVSEAASPKAVQLAEPDRKAALKEVLNLLRPSLCDTKGRWTADHVRLRFSAQRNV